MKWRNSKEISSHRLTQPQHELHKSSLVPWKEEEVATWMASTKHISQEPSSILLGAYEFSEINIISIPKSFLTGN